MSHASWLPFAVADRLCTQDRSAQVLAWLTTLRAQIEDYDAPVRPPSSEESFTETEDDFTTDSPDSAFDEILSQLGNEIYKLDEYQRHLVPDQETTISHSILDLFDQCLGTMTAVDETNQEQPTNGIEESEGESTLSEVSFITSTPVKVCDPPKVNEVSIFDKGTGTPSPPRRVRPQTASSVYSECDNMDVENKPRPTSTVESLASRLVTDSDSESTCWSYKDCNTDTENEDNYERYATVWSHSTGYHNSDKIIRRVLSQNHAVESRVSFDTTNELPPPSYSIYALPEVDRCPPVAVMSPGALDGYEPVRDTIDENIYEEIEFGGSYTDEGCSCEGSVEVESCSVSASSEAGRESPIYANLRDHDAYAVPPDVIAWKNLLLHPDYNDDEEDEWITPEECAVFAHEPRPPLVIPRISQHRTRVLRAHQPLNYTQESTHESRAQKASSRQYTGLREWSPQAQRPIRPTDSPIFTPPNKRLGGSTENLLTTNARRPNHLPLPASSSDNLDVDLREKNGPGNRNRKSRSMVVAAKQRLRSPVPAPRMLLRIENVVETPVYESPVKRTKFAESGKRCRKHWNDCYMILTQTALKCYKDQKTYEATKSQKQTGTPPSPTAPRSELELPLKNAHIMPCNHQHTSRFARSLLLMVGYNHYLIQDETKEGAMRWLELIQNTIYKLGPPAPGTEYSPYQSSNTDLESLGRTPPAARHPSRVKQKAGGSSNEDLSDTTEVSYVKSKLRKFFARRPAIQVLVDKGIYKDEPVFGRNLEEVCPPTPPRVPKFVVKCVEEIERTEENMCTDGLYRASGNLSQVQKIRLEIDQNNLSVIENSSDIHVLTGSLKLFFRELKEPLIPCKVFDRVLAACSIKPRDARTKEFREIVRALPACNRDTLKYLLEHLLRVTTYSEKNRMHTANLAIVFGPTLLWAPAEQAHNIALDCIQQNNVVDILLTDFKEIFAEDTGKNKKKA